MIEKEKEKEIEEVKEDSGKVGIIPKSLDMRYESDT